MTDEPLCSCGSELRVQAGGFIFCEHCDRPAHPLMHCPACIRYDGNIKRRYTEAGS